MLALLERCPRMARGVEHPERVLRRTGGCAFAPCDAVRTTRRRATTGGTIPPDPFVLPAGRGRQSVPISHQFDDEFGTRTSGMSLWRFAARQCPDLPLFTGPGTSRCYLL